MACILQPECNFLQGFFRCCLPVEMVDVKVRITSMQGTHMFRRDRTCQIIKCNPWSTRLLPPHHYQEHESLPWSTKEVRAKTPAPIRPIKTHPTNYQHLYEKGNQGNWEKKEAYPYKEIQSKSHGKTWIQQHNHVTTHNNFQSPNWFGKSKTFTRRYFREQPPPLENIPVHAGTPWPKAGKCLGTFLNQGKTGQSLLKIITKQ